MAAAFASHADFYVNKYFPESIVSSGKLKIIRVENFESDFLRHFGKFVDVSRIPRKTFQDKTNVSLKKIPTQIEQKLRNRAAYDYCPAWASIEEIFYGAKN